MLMLSFLGIAAFAGRSAQAKSSGIFLETIGISTGAGAVLGASTLPFYEKPGDHLVNVLYGASVGALAGLAIWLYGKYAPANEDEDEYTSYTPARVTLLNRPAGMISGVALGKGTAVEFPLVSLNW